MAAEVGSGPAWCVLAFGFGVWVRSSAASVGVDLEGGFWRFNFYSGPRENNFAEQIWYGGGGGGGGNRGFWFESGSGGGLGSGRAEQSRVGGL